MRVKDDMDGLKYEVKITMCFIYRNLAFLKQDALTPGRKSLHWLRIFSTSLSLLLIFCFVTLSQYEVNDIDRKHNQKYLGEPLKKTEKVNT